MKKPKKSKEVLINVKDQAIDRVETLKTEPTTGEESNKIKKIATDTKKHKKEVKNMTDKNQKKQDDNQNSIDSAIVGVAEDIAMAGVTVAGTMGQKNKKTTKKAKKVLINVKGHASNYIRTLKVKPNAEKETHAIKKIASKKKVTKKAKKGG